MARKSEKITIPVDIITNLKSSGGKLADLMNSFNRLQSKDGFSKPQMQFVSQLEKTIGRINSLTSKTWDGKNLSKYQKTIQDINLDIAKMEELAKAVQNSFTATQQKALSSVQDQIRKKQFSIENQKSQLAQLVGVNPAKSPKDFNRILNPSATSTVIQAGRLGSSIKLTDKQAIVFDRLKRSLAENSIELQKLKQKEEAHKKSLENVNVQSKIYEQTLNELQTAQKGVQKAYDSANSQAVLAQADALQEKMKRLVTQFVGFRAAVRTGRKQIIKAAQAYKVLDDSYSNIAAVAGKTRKQMWAMNEQFNEMAQRLGTTTQKVVEASKLYYQQGRSQAEVMDLVEQTTILATVSELDFAKATNYMTAAINGFGIKASEAVTITDTWAALAASSAVDVKELATAISKVASLAGSVGMSMESTSAFLSKMIETTREAPENLGTGLKTIIARFSEMKKAESELADGTPINRVEEALKIANVDLRSASGQIRDFDDIILDLSKAWDTLGVNEQRYIATQAAGSRQQSRFIALVEDYDRNLELMEIAQDSAGAASQQFSTQITGLQASMNRLKSAWEGLYTSFESGPTLFSGLVDTAAKLVSTLADFGGGNTLAALAVEALTFRIATAGAALAIHTAKLKEDTLAQRQSNLEKLKADTIEKRKRLNAINREAIGGIKETKNRFKKGNFYFDDDGYKYTYDGDGRFNKSNKQYKKSTIKSQMRGVDAIDPKEVQRYQQDMEKNIDLRNTSSKALKKNKENLEAYGVQLETLGEQNKKGSKAMGAFSASVKNAKTNIAKMAKSFAEGAIAAAPYVLGILAVTAAIGGIVFVATKAERDIKKLDAEMRKHRDLSIQYNSEAKSVDNLLKKYNELYETGQDMTDIKQQIVDKYKDEISNIETLVDDYSNLNLELKKYQKEKLLSSGKEAIASFNSRKELDQKKDADRQKVLQGKIGKSYDNSKTGGNTQAEIVELANGEYAVISGTISDNFEEISDSLTQSAIDSGKVFGNLKDAQNEMATLLGYSTEEVETLLDLSEASRIASGMEAYYNLNPDKGYAGTKISGGLLKSFQAERSNATISALTGLFTDVATQQEFADVNKLFFNNISNIEDPEFQKQIWSYIEGNFDGLDGITIAKIQSELESVVDQMPEAFADLSKGMAENVNQAYTDARANLDTQLKSRIFNTEDLESFNIQAIGMKLGTDLLFAIEKGFPSAAITAFYQKALDSSLKNTEIDGESISDLLLQIDPTDGDQLLDFLHEVEQNAPEAAKGVRQIVEEVSRLSGYTLEFNLGDGGESQRIKDWEQLKTARDQGVDTKTMHEMVLANEALTESMFEYDKATLTWKLTNEECIQVAREGLEVDRQQYLSYLNNIISANNWSLAIGEVTEANYDQAAAEIENSIASGALMSMQSRLQTEYGKTTKEIDKVSEALEKNTTQAKLNALAAVDAALYQSVAAQFNRLAAAEGGAGTLSQADQDALWEQAINMSLGVNHLEDLVTSINDAKESLFGDKLPETYFSQEEKNASDATKELTNSIKEQIKVLQEQKKALENSAKVLGDALKNRLKDELDYYNNSVNNYYEALDKALDALIDKAKDGLDKLKDEADKLKDIADDNGDDLKNQADAMVDFYDGQIGVIQAKIDALNKEKDAMADIQKMQEARDRYEQAKQKTRLVLTHGGGWRFKTDMSELEEAEKNLASAEQERQVDLLQQQIDNLEEIKSQWQEIAENIGKATSELEEEAKLQAHLNGLNQDQLNGLKDQFQAQVNVNNILVEQAKQAQDKYEAENDKDVEGTLAWQTEQWEKAKEQAQKDKEKFEAKIDPNKQQIADLQNKFENKLGDASQESIDGVLNKGNRLGNNAAEKINSINATLDRLEEVMKTIGMTSEEIEEYNRVISEVSNASLDSILEGGEVYNQLIGQIDEAHALQDKITELENQISEIENGNASNTAKTAEATKSIKDGTGGPGSESGGKNLVSQGEASNKVLNQIKSSVMSMDMSISSILNNKLNCSLQSVVNAINNIKVHVSVGGTNAVGGVIQDSSLHKMDGTTLHPEMVLNANQSAKLFNWIDELPNRFSQQGYMPSFTGKQTSAVNNTTNAAPTFENCKFNIQSNADSLDGLVRDIKRQTPFR